MEHLFFFFLSFSTFNLNLVTRDLKSTQLKVASCLTLVPESPWQFLWFNYHHLSLFELLFPPPLLLLHGRKKQKKKVAVQMKESVRAALSYGNYEIPPLINSLDPERESAAHCGHPLSPQCGLDPNNFDPEANTLHQEDFQVWERCWRALSLYGSTKGPDKSWGWELLNPHVHESGALFVCWALQHALQCWLHINNAPKTPGWEHWGLS